jgi:catechol 2,3-dioxygenase-like lactoylglutathione lyase family enzyme
MAPRIDHLAIPARRAETAAHELAALLGVSGVEPDGPDDDMFRVDLDGSAIQFADADEVPAHHVAFRVDEDDFAAVVERLRNGGVAFGNEPADPANGRTEDFLGGAGRVYFVSGDGHLFEVTA